MVSEKLADRLIRDLPAMSADELGLTIDMVNDWPLSITEAEAERFRPIARKMRDALNAECERRNPKATPNGT